jgi:vitamin K-dependent gamma-carboxylase
LIATGSSAGTTLTSAATEGHRSLALRACSAALRPIDGAWLAALRIAFGVVLAISMLRFLAYGWVERFFVLPRFHFTYWGFSWVEPLSAAGMHALFWTLFVLAIAIALGAAFRVSAAAFALGLSYVQLVDVTTYLNHYYLAALLAWLLALSPAAQLWSVDAWLRKRRARATASPATASIPAGFLYLFRFQVALVYTFAGLAKLQSDWLWHAQPLRIWLGAKVDLPVVGPLLTLAWLPLALSWAGFLFDTTVVGWLCWRRSRPWAYAAVIAFHVLTRVLFPIGMFPAIMIAAALVFFSPSWPRILLHWLRRLSPLSGGASGATGAAGAGASPSRIPTKARWALACGALYCAVQLALPLRAAAYGGNVLWHEQGMRFSWRVMLRAKGGSTTFVVRDKQSGRTVYVSPRAYLTDLQESEMSSQPDLILQLAHHIRDHYARQGFHDPEVRVDARVSLNGRRSVPLIDPAVDLSTVHDGLSRAAWIMPAPRNPPPHTRPVL